MSARNSAFGNSPTELSSQKFLLRCEKVSQAEVKETEANRKCIHFNDFTSRIHPALDIVNDFVNFLGTSGLQFDSVCWDGAHDSELDSFTRFIVVCLRLIAPRSL